MTTKGTPEEMTSYRRRGRKLTNAEHSKVVEKQIRQQTRKDVRKKAASDAGGRK